MAADPADRWFYESKLNGMKSGSLVYTDNHSWDTHGACSCTLIVAKMVGVRKCSSMRDADAIRATSACVDWRIQWQAVMKPLPTFIFFQQHVQDILILISTRVISHELFVNSLNLWCPLRKLPLTAQHRHQRLLCGQDKTIWRTECLRFVLLVESCLCFSMMAAAYECGVTVETGLTQQHLWNTTLGENAALWFGEELRTSLLNNSSYSAYITAQRYVMFCDRWYSLTLSGAQCPLSAE